MSCHIKPFAAQAFAPRRLAGYALSSDCYSSMTGPLGRLFNNGGARTAQYWQLRWRLGRPVEQFLNAEIAYTSPWRLSQRLSSNHSLLIIPFQAQKRENWKPFVLPEKKTENEDT